VNSSFDDHAGLVARALAEDVGAGDVTVHYFTDTGARARAVIASRQSCVLAGLGTAAEVFRQVDAGILFEPCFQDGDQVAGGSIVVRLEGSLGALLTGERVALNFLQRLSGVATLTRKFVEEVRGTSARILDTRKTTPGLRALEKQAVLAGGGSNHRMGLYDMAMIKDNHLAAGSDNARLQAGIDRLKSENQGMRVEVEVDSLAQLAEVFSLRGVDVILLDNMSVAELQKASAMRPPGVLLEASGGVSLETVRAIAQSGVDLISVGALTHSAPAIDLGLDIL
jgi:nicotinate-nucleotide pyrophosphorylase (carboxylating)